MGAVALEMVHHLCKTEEEIHLAEVPDLLNLTQ